MKSLFSAEISICLRTVLLFGLFNGLLFSCGEGIRLLPFPAAGFFHQTTSDLKTGKENNYEKNIHRFEVQPTNSQFKYQRDYEKHWLNFESSRPEFLLSELTNGPEKGFPVYSAFSQSLLFIKNIGSRAPPVA